MSPNVLQYLSCLLSGWHLQDSENIGGCFEKGQDTNLFDGGQQRVPPGQCLLLGCLQRTEQHKPGLVEIIAAG